MQQVQQRRRSVTEEAPSASPAAAGGAMPSAAKASGTENTLELGETEKAIIRQKIGRLAAQLPLIDRTLGEIKSGSRRCDPELARKFLALVFAQSLLCYLPILGCDREIWSRSNPTCWHAMCSFCPRALRIPWSSSSNRYSKPWEPLWRHPRKAPRMILRDVLLAGCGYGADPHALKGQSPCCQQPDKCLWPYYSPIDN